MPSDLHPRERRSPSENDAAARVGAGTAVTSVAWIAARALALVTLVLLTRALSPSDLGALLAAIAAGLLGATLATGGLPDATTRNAVVEEENGGFGRGDLWAAFLRFGAFCPAIVLLLVIMADDSAGIAWDVLAASVLLAVTQGGTSILASVFRARGQAGRFALASSLVVSVGRAAAAVIALSLDLGAGFVLWSFVALNAAVICGTWSVTVIGLPRSRSRAQGEGSLHLGGAVWALLAHLDVVVVGLLVGAEAAGVYGATLRLAEFSWQLLAAVTVLYLPEAAKLAIARRRAALTALYRTTSRWSALVSLLLAGLGFIAAPWIAELLFPDSAGTSQTIQRILFAGYAVYGSLGLGYLTAVSLGLYREIRTAALVALPAIVSATVIAAAVWGATGAACATAAGYVLLTLYWCGVVRRELGATPLDSLYLRGVLACAASLGAAAVLASLLDVEPLPAVVMVGLAGGGVWLLLVIGSGAVRPSELRALRQMTLNPIRP